MGFPNACWSSLIGYPPQMLFLSLRGYSSCSRDNRRESRLCALFMTRGTDFSLHYWLAGLWDQGAECLDLSSLLDIVGAVKMFISSHRPKTNPTGTEEKTLNPTLAGCWGLLPYTASHTGHLTLWKEFGERAQWLPVPLCQDCQIALVIRRGPGMCTRSGPGRSQPEKLSSWELRKLKCWNGPLGKMPGRNLENSVMWTAKPNL